MSRLSRPLLLSIVLVAWGCPHGVGAAARGLHPHPTHRQAKLAAALERSIAQPATYRHLRIDIRGFLGKGLRSLSVYGRGFAVWNREREIGLTEDQIRSCLKVLERYHFTSMPERAHSKEPTRDRETDEEQAAHNVTQLIRSVTLTIADLTHTVDQFNQAPESARFKELVDALVAICRPAAKKTGLTATDLHDGLVKISNGTLAPELLHVSIEAPELRSLTTQDGQGWTLSLANSELIARRWTLREGPGKSVRRWLTDDTIRSLARVLSSSHAASLPGNLNLPGYLQLSITVLNRHRSIMARRYATIRKPTPKVLHDFMSIRAAFFHLFRNAFAPHGSRPPATKHAT